MASPTVFLSYSVSTQLRHPPPEDCKRVRLCHKCRALQGLRQLLRWGCSPGPYRREFKDQPYTGVSSLAVAVSVLSSPSKLAQVLSGLSAKEDAGEWLQKAPLDNITQTYSKHHGACKGSAAMPGDLDLLGRRD